MKWWKAFQRSFFSFFYSIKGPDHQASQNEKACTHEVKNQVLMTQRITNTGTNMPEGVVVLNIRGEYK